MKNDILKDEGSVLVSDRTITLDELKNNGLSKSAITRAVQKGELVRVGRGLYHNNTSDTDVDTLLDDEMFSLGSRFKKLIYSHDTSLYLHDLNERDPLKYSVTVPRGYKTSKLIDEGLSVFSVNKEMYHEHIVEVETMYGNYVRTYSIERTLCDCLRHIDRLQSEIVLSALKRYVRRNDRDLLTLSEIAKQLKVDKLLKTYLEVLV